MNLNHFVIPAVMITLAALTLSYSNNQPKIFKVMAIALIVLALIYWLIYALIDPGPTTEWFWKGLGIHYGQNCLGKIVPLILHLAVNISLALTGILLLFKLFGILR